MRFPPSFAPLRPQAVTLAMLTALVLASACGPRASTAPRSTLPFDFPFAVDSLHSREIAPGVVHRTLYARVGPWVAQVLDVRLDRCYSALALKGGNSAVGRTKTSELVFDAARTQDVLGGVNADFFLFTPAGVPTGLHVSRGRVITPPSDRPVFAIDSLGRPHIGVFRVEGAPKFAVDDPALARISLRPFHPIEAVGGRPVLLRDSMIVDDVDTEGQASFATARHPRTAVGIADGGKRLVLVVVDGRQPTFSAGMSLRETAVLMRALGAREAINLDGGGSSAMVYADPALRGLWHIANRPSDPTGERAVGNALAIVKGCRQ
jgi:hypothetical protein